MCQITVNVPSEVLSNTKMDAAEAASFARKMVALGFYTRGNVSIGYCADIAGLTEEEFIVFLGQNKIDIFRFDDESELEKDIASA